MDGPKFDALTRLVSGGASRRATLKGLLGRTVKGAAVAVGVSAASTIGTHTAVAARCTVEGERHCGKECYNPNEKQCCQKGQDPSYCPFGTECCGLSCCDATFPFCCRFGSGTQCQTVPCA